MADGRKHRLSLKSKSSLTTKLTTSRCKNKEAGILPKSSKSLNEPVDSSNLRDQGRLSDSGGNRASVNSDVIVLSDSGSEDTITDVSRPAECQRKTSDAESRPVCVDTELLELRAAIVAALRASPVRVTCSLPPVLPAQVSKTGCRCSETRETTRNVAKSNDNSQLPPLPRVCRRYLAKAPRHDVVRELGEELARAESSKQTTNQNVIATDGSGCSRDETDLMGTKHVSQSADSKQSVSNKRPLFLQKPPVGASSLEEASSPCKKKPRGIMSADVESGRRVVDTQIQHRISSESDCARGSNLKNMERGETRDLSDRGVSGQRREVAGADNADSSPDAAKGSSQVQLVASCPLCQHEFPSNTDQMGRDDHIALCLAMADDDAFDDL